MFRHNFRALPHKKKFSPLCDLLVPVVSGKFCQKTLQKSTNPGSCSPSPTDQSKVTLVSSERTLYKILHMNPTKRRYLWNGLRKHPQ